MKNSIIILLLLLLTSFKLFEEKIVTNGIYIAKIDTQYKNTGLKDFEFRLQDSVFTLINPNNIPEPCQVIWRDKYSMRVLGCLEPTEKDRPHFIDKEEYFYFLFDKNNDIPHFKVVYNNDIDNVLFSGTLVKK